MDPLLAGALEGALGTPVRSSSPVRGGDTATAYRVELMDGRTVFAKTHAAAPDGFFTTEAAGLRWLADADAIRVPEVLAVGDDPAFLALEWLEVGRADPGTESRFGRSLAALHRSGAPSFGRPDGRPTGSRSLPNAAASTWAEFYRERRLLPLADMAESPMRSTGTTSCVSGVSPPASRTWSGPRRHLLDCTVTCGRATGSSTTRGRAGSSTPPRSAVTASSIWP